MTATVTDVRCRLFEAHTERGDIRYANPMRAWVGSENTEATYAFHQWLVVEVELSSGTIGIGNTGLAPRLAAAIVETSLKPIVVGRRVTDIQDIFQRMYRSIVAFSRQGVGMAAVSAIDIGLWDALAKEVRMPLCDLLGGRTSETVPVYASRLYGGEDLDTLACEAKSYVEQGFRAMKQRFVWGPADGLNGMRRNVELVRTVREAIGDDIELMGDAYMGWDLEYARRMVKLLEPFGLRWLEEPLLPDGIGQYEELTRNSPIPIAAGEHESTLSGFGELIRRRAIDVVQFDTNRVGGITEAVKICALAEAAGLPAIPHGGQLHNYHVVMSQPACPIAEYFPPNGIEVGNELPHWLFRGEPVAVEGAIRIGDAFGLGLEVWPMDPVREISL